MTLLSILISILMEKFLTNLQEYRSFRWLPSYCQWFTSKLNVTDNTWALLIILAPLIILAALIIMGSGSLLSFLLGLLILVYTIGPKTLNFQVQDFLDANERNDQEGTYLYAQQIQPSTQESDSPEQLNQHVINAILSETNDRILGIIFWFVILGPVGALLFRLSSQLKQLSTSDEFATLHEPAARLYYILAWLPARLTGFSYALGGSMVDAMNNWRNYDGLWAHNFANNNDGIMISLGLGALQVAPDCQENNIENIQLALSLSNRAIIIWISLIAVMTLAGLA